MLKRPPGPMSETGVPPQELKRRVNPPVPLFPTNQPSELSLPPPETADQPPEPQFGEPRAPEPTTAPPLEKNVSPLRPVGLLPAPLTAAAGAKQTGAEPLAAPQPPPYSTMAADCTLVSSPSPTTAPPSATAASPGGITSVAEAAAGANPPPGERRPVVDFDAGAFPEPPPVRTWTVPPPPDIPSPPSKPGQPERAAASATCHVRAGGCC